MITMPSHKGSALVKPQVVVDYNFGMKGVDMRVQLTQSYPITRKSLK